MFIAAGDNIIGAHISDGIIAIAAVILAYLLARNGSKADARDQASTKSAEAREKIVAKALDKLADRFDKMNDQLIGLLTLMTPTLAEIEQLQAHVAEYGKELATLKEWRQAHEKWSIETISRIEKGLSTSRRNDSV